MKHKSAKEFKVPSPKTKKMQKAAIDETMADALRWAERYPLLCAPVQHGD